MALRIALLLCALVATADLAAQTGDLNDLSRVPRVTVDELKKLMATNAVVVIDVRSDDVYRAGHIPGAVLIPLETVTQRAKDLKALTKPIVTYCS